MDFPADLFTPIKQQKVYNQIVEQFIEFIESGEFKPGMQLPPERDLAQKLRVSRASLREALTVLQMMGMVETISGQGRFIKDKSQASFPNFLLTAGESPFVILQARKSLEPAVAALAAKQRSESAIQQIDAILRWVEADHSTVQILGDVFSEGDRRFHLEVAKASENPILINFQEVIFSLMSQELWLAMMRHTSFATYGRWEEALREHRGIFDAIRSGDSKTAANRMMAHLQRVENVMVNADLVSNVSKVLGANHTTWIDVGEGVP
jgi:GntR family transcriptional repressor for pyruvate dehydrogenase complex